MVIYGVALLSGSMLVGLVAGDLLGQLIGVEANVGGVGIAMLLLLIFTAGSFVGRAFASSTHNKTEGKS